MLCARSRYQWQGQVITSHSIHDYVIQWKYFPRYWPFVRGIHPVNSPHKGQWRGALMFSLICARINGSVNNGEAGDWRRNHAHYDVTVMSWMSLFVPAHLAYFWHHTPHICGAWTYTVDSYTINIMLPPTLASLLTFVNFNSSVDK